MLAWQQNLCVLHVIMQQIMCHSHPIPQEAWKHSRSQSPCLPVTAGVSMENFLLKGKPARVNPLKVVDFMMNKLNKTQVMGGSAHGLRVRATSPCSAAA